VKPFVIPGPEAKRAAGRERQGEGRGGAAAVREEPVKMDSTRRGNVLETLRGIFQRRSDREEVARSQARPEQGGFGDPYDT